MDAWKVTLLVALIGASSGAITAFVGGLVDRWKKKKENEDSTAQIMAKLNELEWKLNKLETRLGGLERAQKITMQERIKRLAMKYCEKGEISTSDYAVIKEMHDIYHKDLGGNGFLTAVMDDVENLPRIR